MTDDSKTKTEARPQGTAPKPFNEKQRGDGDLKAARDFGKRLQAHDDEVHERGYIGTVPDGGVAVAHSLRTGPDAPPLQPDDRTRAAQPVLPAPRTEED